ncbi:MAG: hypothetical protein U0K86_03445 [Agathobacter sp.]|nr:hypothetical protein [Agathobacter sp.]
MDKYEYNLKLDQIKTLIAEESYDSAAEIADTINWNKIRNVNALVKAGEVYEKVERYQDSRDVLLMAYDRSPIGRMIIYRLAQVAIKMKDFSAAEEYYNEFVEIAPHDNLKYVLKYDIQKAQGASYDVLIPILEDLKEQEYTEEWAYELAYLYHKAGKVEKCIEACDELILWFGDGPYVERALELKMLYQPLNKVQEEKYRRFRQEKAGLTVIGAEEMRKAGEIERESVAIPPIQAPTEKFSTVNLQQEIAKGMQQIIEATEKETVSDTMDNIKKIVEDIPFLQIEREKDESDSLKNVVSDEEIDGSLKIDFQEMLEEESDGQLSLLTNDRSNVERQITGQISIADVLEEWERTRRAAEAALQAADQRKLESAKARALHEAEDIMERLNDVIPKLDAGVTPKELLEEEYLQKNENELSVDGVASEEGPVVSLDELVDEEEPVVSLDELVDEEEPVVSLDGLAVEEELVVNLDELVDEEEPVAVPDELVVEEEPIAGLDMLIEEEVFNEEIEEPVEEESSVLGMEESVVDDNSLADIEKSVDEEKTIDDDLLEAELDAAVEIDLNDIFNETGHSEEISSEEDKLEHEILENNITSTFKPVDIVTDLALAAQSEEGNGVGEQFNRVNSILGNQVSEISAKDPEIEEKLAFAATQKLPTIELLQELGAFDNTNDEAEEEVEELSEEQKAMFSYFIPVKGMEKQLSKVVSSISKHLMNKESASTGNLIVQGEQGCGKTMLATCIIKVLQNECDKPGKKIGKISAENINGKDLHQVVKKVAGGCLIIESAGKLDKKTMTSLSLVMERDNSGTLYILEDTSKGIKKLLSRDEIFASKFTEKVTVPMFTNDDLVAFARSYSRELGYEIDAMAVLALHNRISNIEKLDQATTITEVKEIVDEAIKDEAKIGLRKYFSILTAKRYTEDDKIVLTERNFEKY